MTTFTPREIVSELDRFIVGQKTAKRAVAIALRNRWRRQQIEGALKDEVLPKNNFPLLLRVLGNPSAYPIASVATFIGFFAL